MDTKTQAILNQLAYQRNAAQDALAGAVGDLAEALERIAALEKKLAAVKDSAPA